MTSVDSPGSAKIESWMVSKLFGASSNEQSADRSIATTPALTSAATTVSTGTGGNVSNTTVQALADLKAGGSDGSSTASSEPQIMTLAQSNAMVKAVNAMTADQINEAMYGDGLPNSGGVVGSITSFSDILAMDKSYADQHLQNAADPSLSDADRQAELTAGNQMKAMTSALETAYNNHTLVFQKASDVQGLKFSGTYSYSGFAQDHGATEVGWDNVSYDSDFVYNNPDGKSRTLFDTGDGLQMVAIW